MTHTAIYIASGGVGAAADQVVRTVLAQFESLHIPITIFPLVRDAKQLEQVVADAAAHNGIVVHTLVDTELREVLIDLAHDRRVVEIDLVGALLSTLQSRLDRPPLGQPGLYRKLREHDLRRIEAIEFAVAHDDGQRIEELGRAEIVLTGVSRVGKTPLSMYLSTLGWKVANIPLIDGMSPAHILFEIDRRRVVGLTMQPGQLVAYRQRRQKHLGTPSYLSYAKPEELVEELEFADRIFRQGQFTVVDMTDKPIEESAHEIINTVTRRLA